jgi:hypothetical protein
MRRIYKEHRALARLRLSQTRFEVFFLSVSHLIYVVVAGCGGERWTVQPRYFTA